MERHLRHEGWNQYDCVTVRGRAFDDGTLLAGEELAQRFGSTLDDGDCDERLAAIAAVADGLEGFYAAVVDPPGTETFLVADGARSIPLYYSQDSQVVSDHGRAVAEAIDAPIDSVTASEFLLTRYVTGPDTIWKGVHSIQAGEVVRLSTEPVRRTYRDHWPSGGETNTNSTAVLDAALERALDRLETVADGRHIVVPLSGGYDSRLLAASLAERSNPVTGFTFGRPGHPDVEVSREVASRLGIDWALVEYEQDGWWEWYHGARGRRFREWAAVGDALPFMAAQLAVQQLVETERVPKDALWCPGHSVVTPGERLPVFTGETDAVDGRFDCVPAVEADESPDERQVIEPSVDALVTYVLERHYSLWEYEDPRFDSAARERIKRGLLGDRNASAVGDPTSAAAAYERWEWRGRGTTFTTGDVRGYEAAGVDWWLPLWDPAYVRAYQRLPVVDRRAKRAHAALAVERYRRVADVSSTRASVTDRTLAPFDRLTARMRYMPARTVTRDGISWEPPFLTPRVAWRTPGTHPLAWYGIVAPELLETVPEDRSLYALRTLAAIRGIDLADSEAAVPTESTIDLPTAADDCAHATSVGGDVDQ